MNFDRLTMILTCWLVMTGLLLLGGCGGGSSGGSNNSNATPTTLKLTVEAANVPSGTVLGALQGTITIPDGVSLRTNTGGEVTDGQVTAAGTAAGGSPQVIANYNSSTRQLSFAVVSPAVGFSNGACVVITFDVTAGTTVSALNFTVISAQGKDYTTAAAVPGVVINLK